MVGQAYREQSDGINGQLVILPVTHSCNCFQVEWEMEVPGMDGQLHEGVLGETEFSRNSAAPSDVQFEWVFMM